MREEDLVRANGMMNTAAMLTVIFGPGAAGLLARHLGQDAVYWAIFATIAAGLCLMLIVPDRRPHGEEQQSFVGDLADGFRVSWREPELRSLMLLAGSAWFLMTVLLSLEPLFVKQVLHRGIDSLGFLWSSNGVGAFLGALAVTRMRRASGREILLIGITQVVGAVGILLYVGTPLFALAVVGNALFGVSFAWFTSLSMALTPAFTL